MRLRPHLAVILTAVLICGVAFPASAVDDPRQLLESARSLLPDRPDEAAQIVRDLLARYPNDRLIAANQELVATAFWNGGLSQLKKERFEQAADLFAAVQSMQSIDARLRYDALAAFAHARERVLSGWGILSRARRELWCETAVAWETVVIHSPYQPMREWAAERLEDTRSQLASAHRVARIDGFWHWVPFPEPLGEPEQCSAAGAAAAKYARVTCDRYGDPERCSQVGVMYEQGLYIAANPKLAVEYYRLGCDGGDVLGCRGLAMAHHRGAYGLRRLTRAALFYQSACDQGDPLACANLAAMYEAGAGVIADAAKTASLYRKACDLGAQIVCGP